MYCYGGEVWLGGLCTAVRTDQGFPDSFVGWFGVIMGDGEEGTVPSIHAIWLFVSEEEVLKDILLVSFAGVFR